MWNKVKFKKMVYALIITWHRISITCFYLRNIPTLNHWIYLSPLIAVGHILVTNIYDYWGLFACCIFYGLPFGIVASQVATIILEITSFEKYPQAMSLANLSFGVANLISGQLGGNVLEILTLVTFYKDI